MKCLISGYSYKTSPGKLALQWPQYLCCSSLHSRLYQSLGEHYLGRNQALIKTQSMETEVSSWLDFVPVEIEGQTPIINNIVKSGFSASFKVGCFHY